MSRRYDIKTNKVLKAGRLLFNTDNDGLTRIAGAFFAELEGETVENPTTVEGAGIAKTIMNTTRKVMKKKYNIPNLRDLTDKDGLTQLPYSNFIGPGTDLDSALKAGPVVSGPAGEDKNANGLSADAIAKQHDLLYYNAESITDPNEKFKAIQDADAWMIGEVESLPDSKTKSLILKALKVKYAAEKARGKLFYGGKLKFKPLIAGQVVFDKNQPTLRAGQWRPTSKKEYIEDSIEAIIDGKVRTGTFNKKIKTRQDVINENLKIKKELEDEEKAAEIEKKKPFSEADKSILNLDKKMYKQFFTDSEKSYKYVVFFKKNNDIKERPPIEWAEMDEITDYSTGDKYIYNFPIHILDSETYGIDNIPEVTMFRSKGKYVVHGYDNLITGLEKLANVEYNLTQPEIDSLNKYGFIDNDRKIVLQIKPEFINEINAYEIGDNKKKTQSKVIQSTTIPEIPEAIEWQNPSKAFRLFYNSFDEYVKLSSVNLPKDKDENKKAQTKRKEARTRLSSVLTTILENTQDRKTIFFVEFGNIIASGQSDTIIVKSSSDWPKSLKYELNDDGTFKNRTFGILEKMKKYLKL